MNSYLKALSVRHCLAEGASLLSFCFFFSSLCKKTPGRYT
jgi:hypothetical protein